MNKLIIQNAKNEIKKAIEEGTKKSESLISLIETNKLDIDFNKRHSDIEELYRELRID